MVYPTQVLWLCPDTAVNWNLSVAQVCPEAGLSICPQAGLSICPEAGLFVCPEADLSVCLEAGLSVCPEAGRMLTRTQRRTYLDFVLVHNITLIILQGFCRPLSYMYTKPRPKQTL